MQFMFQEDLLREKLKILYYNQREKEKGFSEDSKEALRMFWYNISDINGSPHSSVADPDKFVRIRPSRRRKNRIWVIGQDPDSKQKSDPDRDTYELF